jgi:hypothetical protein
VNTYDPPETDTDVDFRRRWTDSIPSTHSQTMEKIRQERLTMKSGLIRDMNKCLILPAVFKTYCVCLGPYLGITPTEEWKACELSGHLTFRCTGYCEKMQRRFVHLLVQYRK